MLRVIAYTGGENAPARVPRVLHYVEPLRRLGIHISECPSRAGLYPPYQRWKRPLWGLWNVCERLPDMARSYRYKLSFFQRELLSTFTTSEWMANRPRIFDIDDAIWVYRGGGFARRIARFCDHVICGNRFLAEHFSQWNQNISILPSSVDTAKFIPQAADPGKKPIIGWMGLSSGLKYVYDIEPALASVLRDHREVTLRIVSDQPPVFRHLPAGQVEYVRWTEEEEARLLQQMTVGIMPLDDTVLSRGKCSFKMLLYMACGIPVVVSPVGMNSEVLGLGQVGFGAASNEDWVEQLTALLGDPEKASKMGKNGRELVVSHYSIEALTPQFAKTLLQVANHTG